MANKLENLEELLRNCDVELLELKKVLESHKPYAFIDKANEDVDDFANRVVSFTMHVSSITQQLKDLHPEEFFAHYFASKKAKKCAMKSKDQIQIQNPAVLLNMRLGKLRLNDGSRFRGEITQFEDRNAETFYAVVDNGMEINLTIKNLNKLMCMPDRNEVFAMPVGSGCSAVRAKLRAGSKDGGQLFAQLIDYGSELPLKKPYALYELPEKYQTIPPQAVKCMLVDVNQKQPGKTLFLREVIRSKIGCKCEFEVVESLENILVVTFIKTQPDSQLETITKSLSKCLVIETEEEDPGKCEALHKPDELFEPQLLFNQVNLMPRLFMPNEERVQLYVTFVCSPTTFLAQIEKGSENNPTCISWPPTALSISQAFIKKPKVSDIVLALHKGIYYRARILRITDDDLFEVFFFDYGHLECVPQSSLAKYPVSEGDVEYKAVFCRLGDIADLTKQDTASYRKGIKELRNLIQYKSILMCIIEKRPKNELVVVIVDPEHFYVPQVMVEKGFARPQ